MINELSLHDRAMLFGSLCNKHVYASAMAARYKDKAYRLGYKNGVACEQFLCAVKRSKKYQKIAKTRHTQALKMQ